MKKQTIPQEKKKHITVRIAESMIEEIHNQGVIESISERSTMINVLLRRALNAETEKRK